MRDVNKVLQSYGSQHEHVFLVSGHGWSIPKRRVGTLTSITEWADAHNQIIIGVIPVGALSSYDKSIAGDVDALRAKVNAYHLIDEYSAYHHVDSRVDPAAVIPLNATDPALVTTVETLLCNPHTVLNEAEYKREVAYARRVAVTASASEFRDYVEHYHGIDLDEDAETVLGAIARGEPHVYYVPGANGLWVDTRAAALVYRP